MSEKPTFHWRILDGDVFIMCLSGNFWELEKRDVDRIAQALRRRKIDVHVHYKYLSIRNCKLGIFLETLRSLKVDWDNDIKPLVQFLFFDGEHHIPSQKPKVQS